MREADLGGREGSDQKSTFGKVNFEMLVRYQKQSWISLSDAQGKVQSRDRNLKVIRVDHVFKATRLHEITQGVQIKEEPQGWSLWTPQQVEAGRKEIKKLQVHWLFLKSSDPPSPRRVHIAFVMFSLLGTPPACTLPSNNVSDLTLIW